ncbi:hypothetical protein NQ318_000195 [Aromia moschata]|uniref:Cathepsin L n=1 Tax=Aromia moschata TaxID=1265417 RepID=A0AAV8YI49_9CUCU|nr:hypothetical protein NQ318_000195 [Aromia moschata]
MRFHLLLLIVTALTVSAIPSPEEIEAEWSNFKLTHGKQYRSLNEESVRKSIFAENLKTIIEHNKRFDQGLVKYTLKVNGFADMTPQDIKKTLNGYKKKPPSKVRLERPWCCYGHKESGTMRVLLGFQCGCNGGDMNPSFEYVHDNDGIDSEEAYPYQNVDRDSCLYQKYNVTSTKGYVTIEQGSPETRSTWKAAIATRGPIAVAVDASNCTFDFYSGGIYYQTNCITDPDRLDHAVLAVGYGTERGEAYWLVKNSWGGSWGENGYIKMSRNRENNCGIASAASFPINY